MKKTNNLFLIIGSLAILGVLVVFGWRGLDGSSSADKNSVSSGALVASENNFDLGDIDINGGLVRRDFTLRNEGGEAVLIKKVYTSCMCTEAFLRTSGSEIFQGPFGMAGHSGANQRADVAVAAGEKITVEAVFDPMAHGPEATGKIIREIYLETNSIDASLVTLRFGGNVMKEIPRVSGPSLDVLRKEYDFGIVKQSGGAVSFDFEVRNNGDQKVVIDSLPTSCGCVTAQADKKEIAPGERAVITASFDPNLHEEPMGRFFKTVEIVSNVKPSSELKIYAEVDLDLGPDYYKQKEQHND